LKYEIARTDELSRTTNIKHAEAFLTPSPVYWIHYCLAQLISSAVYI
jgi:hypothetical protein